MPNAPDNSGAYQMHDVTTVIQLIADVKLKPQAPCKPSAESANTRDTLHQTVKNTHIKKYHKACKRWQAETDLPCSFSSVPPFIYGAADRSTDL